MTLAPLIDAIRDLLAQTTPACAADSRADVEATLLELAGPAMSIGQLNLLLTVRLESERLGELLIEPEPASETDLEAARARALAALERLAEALAPPTPAPDH